MQLVWESLAGIYGTAFSNSYGDRHDDGAALVWAESLAGFTRDMLHVGLSACARRANGYPPTLPEFRALCLGSSDAPTQGLTTEQRAERDATERAYDLAHFRKMRDLCRERGIKADDGSELWVNEAMRGIPHRTRPKPASPEFVKQVVANIDACLARMVAR